MRHDLKIWPGPFVDLVQGLKTFEVRREDDRTFAVGDYLLLREYDEINGGYTGREILVRVTYLLRGSFGLPHGFVIMSVVPTTRRRSQQRLPVVKD